MKPENKKQIFRTVFGVLLALFFLFLTLKGKNISEIWETIKNANFWYIVLSIFIYLLTFVTRSEKWRIQVENLGYKVFPKTAYFSLMLHYFFNSFTPKLGAIARCGDLKQKNKVPFSDCFASYMSEVVFDFLFLFLGLFIVIIIEFDKIKLVFYELFIDLKIYLDNHQHILFFLVIAGIIFVVVVFVMWKKNLFSKFDNQIKSFFRALAKTFKIKKFLLFIIWNIILWILLFLMNYFLFKSLFDYKINMSFILTITTFTYTAWLIPTPGGIGSVEYFALQAFLLFGLNSHDAVSFGILSNGLTFFTVIIFTIFLMFIQKACGFFSLKKSEQAKLL